MNEYDRQARREALALLGKVPRLPLAHLPTKLAPMPRLTKLLGGPQLWIKRDNQTGLATGGSKTRKLEFVMAEAQAAGATDVITCGATQTNHGRQTAAACAQLGMKCWVMLESREHERIKATLNQKQYLGSGNVFLMHLLGASTQQFAQGTDLPAEMEKLAAKLRADGRTVYIVPGGASSPRGALGYFDCALELLAQGDDQRVRIDTVVHCTGSAGTQGGLVAGFAASKAAARVLGICNRSPRDKQIDKVHRIARDACTLLGLPPETVARSDVMVNDDYIGEGYGVLTKPTKEAVEMTARLEGVLIDPVYSGVGVAGLIDLVRNGHFRADQNIVFLHTGGEASLYAYEDSFTYDELRMPSKL